MLKILHCFRAPVGGLFRHVCDLASAQAERGHKVGLICCNSNDDQLGRIRFNQLSSFCELGIHRVAMNRGPGLGDISAILSTTKIAKSSKADIIHGHGAKGGTYARIASHILRTNLTAPKCYYTPHGGTLHFDEKTFTGSLFFFIERRLLKLTDGLIFESAYSQRNFEQKIAVPNCPHQLVHNGLHIREFEKVMPDKEAADFLFVGELRQIKGADIFIKAMSLLNQTRPATACIIGSGPQEGTYKKLVATRLLEKQIQFLSPRPVREAFKRGHCLVIPSRKEAFPYIVLEAAASHKPMILANVGGIPEIVGKTTDILFPPENIKFLAPPAESISLRSWKL